MGFRLGLVGHHDTLQTVSALVKEYFDGVTVYTEEFGNDEIITNAVQRIAQLQKRCNGILYSRRDPYLLIAEHLQHTVPVSYVEITKSDLLISLLNALIRYELRPENISIDGFDRPSVVEAFQGVGLDVDRVRIQIVGGDVEQEDLVNATLAKHLENHAAGAELCITNITDVCRSLHKRGIPATVINPTARSFVQEIRNLMLRSELRNQIASPVAIIQVRLQYKEKYRFYDRMPIREVDELSNAAKLIAIFAERVDGAMFCQGRWEYLILCSGPLLQSATDNFTDLSLMQSINFNTCFDVIIGIGCGRTIKEAERNALLASSRAWTHRGTNTEVALAPDQLIGPLRPKSEHFTEESVTDARLAEIAGSTGLSINVLNVLFQAILKERSSLFTTAQLAEILDVSTRTTNRLIERLLDQRYATIEGKDFTKPRGRPARVIRLLF